MNPPGGTTINYAYDHEGKRMGKTVDYYFDGDYVIIEAQGASIMAYYTQVQGLISRRRGSSSYFYHYDGLGSTKALTDANQNTQASYTYTILGDIVAQAGTVPNSYKYAGEDGWFLDSDIDLYHSGEIWYTKQLTGDIVLSTYSNNKGKEECPSWYPKSACPEWRTVKKACGGINAALKPEALNQRCEECCNTLAKLYEKYGTGTKVACIRGDGSALTRAQDCHNKCFSECTKKKSGSLGIRGFHDFEGQYEKLDKAEECFSFFRGYAKEGQDFENLAPPPLH